MIVPLVFLLNPCFFIVNSYLFSENINCRSQCHVISPLYGTVVHCSAGAGGIFSYIEKVNLKLLLSLIKPFSKCYKQICLIILTIRISFQFTSLERKMLIENGKVKCD